MVPNGVNIEVYEQAQVDKDFRGKFALPEEKIVLFVGRLVYEKGIHVLINAVPKVLEKVNAKFIIVGSGYMKEQLLNIVRSMGLEHKVLFEGFVDEQSLLKLQKCADVSVVPSLFEPFGIVALEGMAAGRPVLATPVGGLPEFLPEPPNRMIAPDTTAWAMALDEWLHMAESGNLRADGNADNAAHHGRPSVANQYLQIYDRVIQHE